MGYHGIIDEIREEVRAVLPVGRVADYIPMLASVPREKFGMPVSVHGQVQNLFRHDRHLTTARAYRFFRARAFFVWQQVTRA